MHNLSTTDFVIVLFLPTVTLIAAAWVINHQRNKLNEERWERTKVFPLIAEVDPLDENQREYLTPEVVAGLKAGTLDIDEAKQLQLQSHQQPA